MVLIGDGKPSSAAPEAKEWQDEKLPLLDANAGVDGLMRLEVQLAAGQNGQRFDDFRIPSINGASPPSPAAATTHVTRIQNLQNINLTVFRGAFVMVVGEVRFFLRGFSIVADICCVTMGREVYAPFSVYPSLRWAAENPLASSAPEGDEMTT